MFRLHCRGKENGVNILKSIDEGPFRMGTLRETLTKGTEGALHLGSERPRVYSDLTPKEKERYNADIRATNILLQGLPKDIYSLINHYTDAKDMWDNVKKLMEGWKLTKEDRESQLVDKIEDRGTMHGVQVQLVIGELRTELGKMLLMQAQENGMALDEEHVLFIVGGQDNAVDEDVDEQLVQDLALNVDNVFQADRCDTFNSDVDEAPTVQTMFMANLSSADPVYDEAGPSYDSDIITKYVRDNAMPIVQSNVSSIPNDAYMMILNDMHEQPAQHVSVTTKNNVVDKSLTAELATYKEQVELSSKRAGYSFKTNETLMVYPLNTPATLVLGMLLTKSQVKSNIFAFIQLFSKFKTTCKKRITPTGPTEGERGFEQTKECYLTEIIPFFKTLKEHFEGIQKALTKEIKEMKEIFKELEAEVDQNVMHRKHDEIEQKNLLIANDNLIVDCLSKDVFYTATSSVLTVSRFSDMHEALNVAQKSIAELESESYNLENKIQNDDHDVMVNHFSKLEVEHLNMQLKYQHLKESIKSRKSVTSSDAPTFDSVFVIGQLKDHVQSRGNTIHELREKISRLTTKHSKAVPIHDRRYAIDIEPIPPCIRNNREVHLDYLKHLKESVETLHEIVEEAKIERPLDRPLASACLYTKHSF
nr:integrase, catalytic region, zinc finger, CCHC-type, peptidase aspartic, catalytic [Tanacetum cinerariifolium]